MKPLAAILAVSFAANVWLALKWRTAATTPPSPSPAAASSAERVSLPPPPVLSGSANRKPPETEAEFRALRAELEAAGLPPEVVRMAVAVMIHRSFQKRRDALFARPGPDEYWRNPHPRPDPTQQPALQALEREQRRMMREIGSDVELDETAQRRMYGQLPAEKVAKLKKIFDDYSDLEEQMFADITDRGSPEARARSALLAKEKRADIERLLTPAELLDYDLRNSPGAHQLRGRLGQFAATETEFLALYPAFKAATEAEIAALSTNPRRASPEVRRDREAAQRQLDEEMRRVLGETRYAEMKEANDHLLQETRSFAASLHLSPAAATELITVQKEFSPQLTAVERNRDLSPNQRDAQLYALGVAARDRLLRVLGPSGFEAYKRRGGGWLGAALNRAPPTPPVSP